MKASTKQLTLEEFEQRCKNFDHFYDYTDDYGVWRKWYNIHQQLISISNIGIEFAEVYNRYFSRKPL